MSSKFQKQTTSGAVSPGSDIRFPDMPEGLSEVEGAGDWYFSLRKALIAELTRLSQEIESLRKN